MPAPEMNARGFTPWPEELADRYRTSGYWENIDLFSALSASAEQHAGSPAITDHNGTLNYAGMITQARRLAAGYVAAGLGPGERMVIHLPNCNAFVTTLLACLATGVEPIMALPAHREHELAYLFNFSGASAYAIASTFRDFDYQDLASTLAANTGLVKHVFVSTAFGPNDTVADGFHNIEMLRNAPSPAPSGQISPQSVALYLLSGGTTGLPKLIPRTHNDYLYNARVTASVTHVSSATRYLVALPAGHNFPLACPGILGTLLAGGHVIMAPSPSPDVAFPLIEEHGVTLTAVVPAVALNWLDTAATTSADLGSLEVLQVGGSVFVQEAAARVAPVLGCTLQQAFGMAEGLVNLTRLDDDEDAITGTQGRPASDADEVRIVDENGDDVADDTPGELLTRGPYTLRGYFNAPEHNARSFTPDGYYRTGDVVRCRADGNLIVEGRTKDLINRAGEKISAEEIENLVLAHPDVFNVAAVAMDDAKLGEIIALYVVPANNASLSLATLREFLEHSQIAHYKLPERLVVTATLPLTNVGKIDKKALRDDVNTRAAESFSQ